MVAAHEGAHRWVSRLAGTDALLSDPHEIFHSSFRFCVCIKKLRSFSTTNSLPKKCLLALQHSVA
jgi:hypothetical protein